MIIEIEAKWLIAAAVENYYRLRRRMLITRMTIAKSTPERLPLSRARLGWATKWELPRSPRYKKWCSFTRLKTLWTRAESPILKSFMNTRPVKGTDWVTKCAVIIKPWVTLPIIAGRQARTSMSSKTLAKEHCRLEVRVACQTLETTFNCLDLWAKGRSIHLLTSSPLHRKSCTFLAIEMSNKKLRCPTWEWKVPSWLETCSAMAPRSIWSTSRRGFPQLCGQMLWAIKSLTSPAEWSKMKRCPPRLASRASRTPKELSRKTKSRGTRFLQTTMPSKWSHSTMRLKSSSRERPPSPWA